MRENRLKKNKLYFLSVIGALIIFVFMVVGLIFAFAHTEKARESLQSIEEDNILNSARMTALQIDNILSTIRISTEMADQKVLSSDMMKDDVAPILKEIVDTSDATRSIYCNMNDSTIDQDGATLTMTNIGYSHLMNGTAAYFTVDTNMLDTSKKVIIYVMPVVRGAEKYGYILSFIDFDTIIDILKDSGMVNYTFYTFMNSSNRAVYTYSKNEETKFPSDDLWISIQKGALSSSRWVIFNQKNRERMPASMYSKCEDDTRFFCTVPIKECNWTLLFGIAEGYLEYRLDIISDPDTSLRIQLLIVYALIFATYVVIIVLIHNHSDEKNKELEGKADTDLLTGLSNKIATENMIQEYIDNHANGMGVLILIDVDNFKKINDTMGHAFGDEVLKNLGIRLRSLYRVSDIIGRLGGDEFVVFLKDIRQVEVMEREARKLEVFFHGFEVGEYVKYSVTASLGAAVFSKDGKSFEELYHAADTALYAAKHRGKNCLVFCGEEKEKQETVSSEKEEGTE